MARGSIAKTNLLEKFKVALGQDFVGMDSDGKKAYFWSTENGEKMQVCITMTVPKTPLATDSMPKEMVFGDGPVPVSPISEDEQATLDRLMKELNL